MRQGKEVFYVTVGDQAQAAFERSLESLGERHCWPVVTICPELPGMTPKQASRWGKLTLDRYAEREMCLYLDADTLIRGDLSAGFEILESGWDLVIVPSAQQGQDDCLWHIQEKERSLTLGELGYLPLQLQAGVFFVSWNSRTRRLWSAWRSEWLRYRDEDQAALLRALAQVPVKIWLLGYPFNGGAVIEHRCGMLRKHAYGQTAQVAMAL